MTNDDAPKPLHESLDALLLHERRANETRAAAMAREVLDQLAAEGFPPTGATRDALTLRLLRLMNEKLDADVQAIAKHMAESLEPAPTLH